MVDGGLNVVVVGGGPTGVETAGAMAELYRAGFAKDYPNVPQEQARMIARRGRPELFAMFKQDIRTYAKKALEKRVSRCFSRRSSLRSGPRGCC